MSTRLTSIAHIESGYATVILMLLFLAFSVRVCMGDGKIRRSLMPEGSLRAFSLPVITTN